MTLYDLSIILKTVLVHKVDIKIAIQISENFQKSFLPFNICTIVLFFFYENSLKLSR